MDLKACPYRQVDDEGHILCDKIKTGEREVTPNICRACPIMAIHCAHLRAVLEHQTRPAIVVRWGNGKSRVLDDLPATISIERAACAEKVIPIHSPRDCANCALRKPLDAVPIAPTQIPVRGRRQPAPSVPPPVIAPPPPPPQPQPIAQIAQPAPVADQRSQVVHQKIIQLQEWLTKQKQNPPPRESEETPQRVAMPAPPPRRAEEKRIGWTD